MAGVDPLKLHRAKNGQKVKKYINGGVSCSAVDGRGDTVIHAFIRRTDNTQSLDCLFALLIYADYEIDILNAHADTPLHLACEMLQSFSVAMLCSIFRPPYMLGCNTQKLDFVKALIAFDAELNILNGDDRTALDIAEAMECEEITKLLEEVGGLTAKSILDRRQESQGSELSTPDMDNAMATGAVDMTKTLMASKRVASKGQAGSGEGGNGGVCPNVLMSKLEGVNETDYVGYQRERYGSRDSARFSPFEETMYSIPEGDEESEVFESQEKSHRLDQMSIRISKPSISPSQADRKLIANKDDRSPSPGRSSPSRHHSPNRPSTLLQSNVSPLASPVRSRSPARSTAYQAPMTASLLPRSRVPRTSPPEAGHSPRSQSPLIHQSPPQTPPRSKSPNKLRSRIPVSDQVFPTIVNGTDIKKQNHGDNQENGDTEEDSDEATGSDGNSYKRCMQRFAQTVLTCLDEVDPETRKKLENAMKENLNEKDFLKLHNKKSSQPPKHHESKRMEHDRENLLSPLFHKELPQNFADRRCSDGDRPRQLRLPSVGESTRKYRLRGPQAALQTSLSITKSLYNPKMSVTQSGLGTSVKPTRKPTKEGQRGHRILCLDGGGIKGVIELEILRAIERLSGSKIPELFDWIVATSIGGIFALSTVYGNLSLSDLLKFCFEMKGDVAKKQSWWKYSCNTKALESLLKNMVGEDTKMEEKKIKVMVTAVRKGDTSLPLVFFNNCFHDESYGDTVWRVCRRTSAIPAAFQSADGYIDGGLVANNPCNYGLTKIKMFLKETKEMQKERGDKSTICTDIACVLSIGCGKFPSQKIGISDIDDSVLFSHPLEAPQRIKNALTTLLCCIGRSEEDANICRIFCEEMQVPFYRFSPEVDVIMGATETDNLKICEAIISTKKMLHRDEAHVEALLRDIGKEPIPQTRVN